MNQLKKHLIRLHYILGYPFFDAHGKAFARWYVSDSEEKRYQYDDLTEKSLVFDGGGYCGDFSARIFEKYHCTCFIFEPVTEFAEKLKQRFDDNCKIKIYDFGLSGRTEAEKMSISEDGSSACIDKKSREYESVRMKDIREFIEENKIKNIDLFKINIEGGEYRLLDRMIECDLLSIVKHFQIQFHKVDNESGQKMKRIQHILKNTHIPEWSCRPYVWESWIRKE